MIKKLSFFLFSAFCLLFSASRVMASEKLYFIHQDHLGSTTMVTDEQGNTVSKQTYYPYGETRSQQSTISNKQLAISRQYTSQVSDVLDTGLYYYNARYYHPQIAKFTQADNLASNIKKYSYVDGNPIVFTDPSGNQRNCSPGSACWIHNRKDDVDKSNPPLPWDLPWYSLEKTGQEPMLAFLYDHPTFNLENYIALMTKAGYDFSAYTVDAIIGDFSFMQRQVLVEIGQLADPFGPGFGKVLALTGVKEFIFSPGTLKGISAGVAALGGIRRSGRVSSNRNLDIDEEAFIGVYDADVDDISRPLPKIAKANDDKWDWASRQGEMDLDQELYEGSKPPPMCRPHADDEPVLRQISGEGISADNQIIVPYWAFGPKNIPEYSIMQLRYFDGVRYYVQR